jgi:hypothetical protein
MDRGVVGPAFHELLLSQAVRLTAVLSEPVQAEHVKDRLHKAIHRAPKTLSNKELEEVLVVALAAVAELAAEVALIVTELDERVEALEARSPSA